MLASVDCGQGCLCPGASAEVNLPWSGMVHATVITGLNYCKVLHTGLPLKSLEVAINAGKCEYSCSCWKPMA